jgi:hypothetical protein
MEISLTAEQWILLLGTIFVPIIALIVNSIFQRRKLRGVDADTIEKMSSTLNNLTAQITEQLERIDRQDKTITTQKIVVAELLQKIELLQNLDTIRLKRIQALEALVKEMTEGIEALSKQLIEEAKLTPKWKRKTGELEFTKKFADDTQ